VSDNKGPYEAPPVSHPSDLKERIELITVLMLEIETLTKDMKSMDKTLKQKE